MTKLQIDVPIDFPAAQVFATFRDHMAALLPYLSSIAAIEVVSRREEAALVHTATRFRGRAYLPAMLRALLGESLFSWTDHATWDARALSCTWWTESSALGGAVQCGAEDAFVERAPGKTVVQIRGELTVDPEQIRHVPRVAARRLARVLEDFMVTKIASDLQRTMSALSRYLGEQTATPIRTASRGAPSNTLR